MSSIFLCGFMGCGKSTVGKILASLLNCDFIDLDNFIENAEKMTIPEIFQNRGESYFREAEANAIAKLSSSSAVIATGGGALIPEKNAISAKQNGKIIFIDTDFKICYNRIKTDKNRPLASSRTKDELFELFEARKPIYISHSDTIINGNSSARKIALNIKTLL